MKKKLVVNLRFITDLQTTELCGDDRVHLRVHKYMQPGCF